MKAIFQDAFFLVGEQPSRMTRRQRGGRPKTTDTPAYRDQWAPSIALGTPSRTRSGSVPRNPAPGLAAVVPRAESVYEQLAPVDRRCGRSGAFRKGARAGLLVIGWWRRASSWAGTDAAGTAWRMSGRGNCSVKGSSRGGRRSQTGSPLVWVADWSEQAGVGRSGAAERCDHRLEAASQCRQSSHVAPGSLQPGRCSLHADFSLWNPRDTTTLAKGVPHAA
ncbi:hypothetical protein CNYM01_13004 [Colletotrichum nymphaeae SA-01]|uniref:Uncharacterized protein n=1 Tax=Colletotrichum nymphaeae SA-01 TaxID=1460502 RepID=A0A135S9X5_9PEZI|nr:hypothetical protein CNYM01_13004 [Colletotrichum nymphaeae SA-01]